MGNKVWNAIKLVLISAICIYVLIGYFIPTAGNLVGYMFPDQVKTFESAELKEGNRVQIDYDCVLSGYNNVYSFLKTDAYYILKFGEEENFVYISVGSTEKQYLDGCDFFEYPQEAKGFFAEKKHSFIGRVYKIDNSVRESFINRMKLTSYPEYIMINSEENTNLRYYIREIKPINELIWLAGELVVMFILLKFFLRLLSRFRNALGTVQE